MNEKDKIKIAYFKHGPEYAVKELAGQILEWVTGARARGGVVGLSGGIDSTVTALLCDYAFRDYNSRNPDKEKLNLLGLILPSDANPSKDREDGLWVADYLGIERKIISIQQLADPFIKAMPDVLDEKLHIGNLYSEIRADVLSRHAAKYNLLVMGTGNYDEDYVLGYFTKRGDGAVDNNILGNLPKHLVREIALWFNLPDEKVNRVPTAALWEGQTDEGDIGFKYKIANKIQRGYDEGKTREKIAEITGYDMKIIDKISGMHAATEHKRNPPPVGEVELRYR